MLDFSHRHVVVTGATGALGHAVAERLIAAGATCHLPCRRLEGRAKELRDRSDRALFVEGVDLADEAAVAGFYGALPELWASIHCAGAFAAAEFEGTALAELESMLAVNLKTAFLASREALRRIRTGGAGGRIVNVAARPALEPRRGAGMVAYAASKAAVAAMSVALAEEVAGESIFVNAVAPSIIDTPANRAAMPKADASRWPTPAEIAETIAQLASQANRTVQGAVVPVYGRT